MTHAQEAMVGLAHPVVVSMLGKSNAAHTIVGPIILQAATVHALLNLAEAIRESASDNPSNGSSSLDGFQQG